MNNIIKEILETIEHNGYEAYIIGGYVRDYLLNRESYDVDICTNALPKDLINIFNKNIASEYGVFKITRGNYNFDITTYRREKKYCNRRPVEIEYINNLLEDIRRRDFTINTICMNSNGNIIDLMNGINDLNNKKIKIVGDSNLKFKEDPLRILRAVRFACILDFTLDKTVIKAIKKNKKLVSKLSLTRQKQELDKILSSPYVLKGLEMLKKLGLSDVLKIKYHKVVLVNDLAGMYAQIKVSEDYPFTKIELSNIKKIQKVLKYGKIDDMVLYKEGLYISQVAGSILGIDKSIITKNYNNLPIYNTKDINITTKEIIEILNIKPSKIIQEIYSDLEKEIITKKLINEKDIIEDYIKRNKGKWM